MREIIIIGSGGYAAELNDYLCYSNIHNGTNYQIAGYLDDNPDAYHRYSFGSPFLGTISDHSVRQDHYYMRGIANLKYRKQFIDQFEDQGAKFLTYIHPSAFISPSAKINKGVVIAPNVNIGPNVVIGDHTLINSRCSLGHDTMIGKYNFISPNVCFSGFTIVGDENLFGINAATIPVIKVGNKNVIAAGMTLNKDVADGAIVFYRFKEKMSIIKTNE